MEDSGQVTIYAVQENTYPQLGALLTQKRSVLDYILIINRIIGITYQELQLGSKVRGICFYAVNASAALFLFMLMLVVHPFVLLLDRYRRTAHHLIAKIWALSAVTPFLKIEFEGLENLPPPNTPAVYVSNHQSFLDIYALLTLGRSFKFISKTAIFLIPVIGWAMYLMGLIPLKRMDSRSHMASLKRCMDLVKKGGSVFFFPEGTRSKDGKLGDFKKGAFSIAAKARVPVVPITLIGTGKIMPAGMESTLNPGLVKVIIHQPVEGNKADILCSETRTIIAEELILVLGSSRPPDGVVDKFHARPYVIIQSWAERLELWYVRIGQNTGTNVRPATKDLDPRHTYPSDAISPSVQAALVEPFDMRLGHEPRRTRPRVLSSIR
ncbi:hypothetical protein RJ639_011759 [Escallonia herrerae]|uniref:1-acyl-sn-glycerol-3-phosphate acyltransferase n=1 Tax=Escallonia herrerae TaxID=1293975 RepID=A0AA89ARA2_9ASTE|nr:hypothetical protein RJ639_011759 [Escallonia herrerae]